MATLPAPATIIGGPISPYVRKVPLPVKSYAELTDERAAR